MSAEHIGRLLLAHAWLPSLVLGMDVQNRTPEPIHTVQGFPHTAYIEIHDAEFGAMSFCGGAILSMRSVVATCQCLGNLTDEGGPRDMKYRMVQLTFGLSYVGPSASKNAMNTYFVTNTWFHPLCYSYTPTLSHGKFNVPVVMFNIAVIKLERELLPYNEVVRPVDLISTDVRVFNDSIGSIIDKKSTCEIVGWGNYNPYGGTEDGSWKRVRSTRLLTNSTCEDYLIEEFHNSKTASRRWTGYDPNTNLSFSKGGYICSTTLTPWAKTDSGPADGPVVCDDKVIGLYSHSIYTDKQPPGYLDFIVSFALLLAYMEMPWATDQDYTQTSQQKHPSMLLEIIMNTTVTKSLLTTAGTKSSVTLVTKQTLTTETTTKSVVEGLLSMVTPDNMNSNTGIVTGSPGKETRNLKSTLFLVVVSLLSF